MLCSIVFQAWSGSSVSRQLSSIYNTLLSTPHLCTAHPWKLVTARPVIDAFIFCVIPVIVPLCAFSCLSERGNSFVLNLVWTPKSLGGSVLISPGLPRQRLFLSPRFKVVCLKRSAIQRDVYRCQGKIDNLTKNMSLHSQFPVLSLHSQTWMKIAHNIFDALSQLFSFVLPPEKCCFLGWFTFVR